MQAATGIREKLVWMRAWNRATADEHAQTLWGGDGPPPSSIRGTTQAAEKILGIRPPRIYLYLGRTSESFGSVGFALRSRALDNAAAEVSPFDTGGLIRHAEPVCNWREPEKRFFLEKLTWTWSELDTLLAQYPGESPESIAAYLDDQTYPPVAGPDAIWKVGVPANIWAPPNRWPSWTWEARAASAIKTGYEIVNWSCTIKLYEPIAEAIREMAELQGEPEVLLAEHLLRTFKEGGVGELTAAMLRLQLAEAA